MGQTSISWTATVLPDGTTLPGYTFNPWIGCSKVSAGCAHCYAETQNKLYNWTSSWGKGAPRRRTSEANWKKPAQWARQAAESGITRRVFCASLADVFDDEVDPLWRLGLFHMINKIDLEYPNALEWLILTKRIDLAINMLPPEWIKYPPAFVRLGVTAEDQPNAEKRISTLLSFWHGKNFVSYEPALDAIDFTLLRDWYGRMDHTGANMFDALSGRTFWSDGDPGIACKSIDWLICGGESGPGCRPMNIEWARSARDQCKAAGVPYFMKQLGGNPDKRHNPDDWPEDLRVQQFPW